MTYCIEQDSLIRRRSVYALGHTRVVTDFCLEDTLKDCLKNCPTPFNAQSARLVLLLNQYHADFWNLVLQKVLAAAPFNKKESVTQKINSFAAAYGTILFFEDLDTMEKLQKDFPLYQKICMTGLLRLTECCNIWFGKLWPKMKSALRCSIIMS